MQQTYGLLHYCFLWCSLMKCEEVERLEKQIKSLEVLVKLLRAKLKQAREVKKKGAKND